MMKKEIAIIGGGASGVVAAILASKNGLKVTLFEKNAQIAKKILASGNGRCNISNTNLSNSCYFGQNPSFVNFALKEFDYLKRTLDVSAVIDLSEWKFLRTRPTNFPTIRLAQLAAVFTNPDWYSHFVSIRTMKQAETFFVYPVSDYWHAHYRFDTVAAHSEKHIGKSFVLFF